MFIIREEWFHAILDRHSRRSFQPKELSIENSETILRLLEELNDKVKGFKAELIPQNNDDIFKGIISSFGKIRNAPAYVVLIGDTTDKSIEQKIGYYGECLVLEATNHKLGTCWVSGFFSREKVSERVVLNENERIYAVVAIGYVSEEYQLNEKIMISLARSKSRRSFETLFDGIGMLKLPRWLKAGLDSARIAPSAMNRQPWFFHIENNSVSLSNPGNKPLSKLDCGIAMLHFELGALHQGFKGAWEKYDQQFVAVFCESTN